MPRATRTVCAVLILFSSVAALLFVPPALPLQPGDDADHTTALAGDTLRDAPTLVAPEASRLLAGEGDAAAGSPAASWATDDSQLGAPVGSVSWTTFANGAPSKPASVRVRFLSDQRFAETAVDAGPASARLRQGSYQACLRSPGFEPRSIGPFEVADGQTTVLGTVILDAGRGGITGRISAASATSADADKLTVRLTGAGRHPCDRCVDDVEIANDTTRAAAMWNLASPCVACGFTARQSIRRVARGESFSFAGLASGDYLLTVDPPDGATNALTQRIELGPSQWRNVDLTLVDSTSLLVHLITADGRRFDGAIGQQTSTAADTVSLVRPIRFRFRRDLEEDVELVATALPTPSPMIDFDVARSVAFVINREMTGTEWVHLVRSDLLLSESGGPIDRQRTPQDTLDEADRPTRPARPLSAAEVNPGTYRVESLPMHRYQLAVDWGVWRSEWVVVDLRYLRDSQVSVILRETDQPAEDPAQPFVSILGDGLSSGQDLHFVMSRDSTLTVGAPGVIRLEGTTIRLEAISR